MRYYYKSISIGVGILLKYYIYHQNIVKVGCISGGKAKFFYFWATVHNKKWLCIIAKMVKEKNNLLKDILFYYIGGDDCYLL